MKVAITRYEHCEVSRFYFDEVGRGRWRLVFHFTDGGWVASHAISEIAKHAAYARDDHYNQVCICQALDRALLVGEIPPKFADAF